MKNFGFRLILILLAAVFAAIFFEILLRLFTPAPENLVKLKSSANFLHENKPSVEFRHTSGEFDNKISINSYGFRDDEFYMEKTGDIIRIAVLGDSQEEALQVALFDTWQKIMARKLAEGLKKKAEGPQLNRRVETYNFGVSGYGTDQQWLTLSEKVWQFKPDMIILAFSPNDVGDAYKNKLIRIKNGQVDVISQRERSHGNWLGEIVRETYSYHIIIKAASGNALAKGFVDKVRTKILGFGKEERFFLSDAQLVQGPFEVIASQKNPPKEVLESWFLIKALIEDMKSQTEAHKAKFLITINIPRAQVSPEGWEQLRVLYKLDTNSSSPYEINDVMAKIAEDLNIDFYDPRLDAIDWKVKLGDLHYPKDAHFNKNGNLFMGTKVAEFIVENDLISD